MKIKILKPFILFAKAILKLIYAVMKLFPVKDNKVLFCSRQSDDVPLDFRMIQEELLRKDVSLCFVSICNRLEDGMNAGFAWDMLRSMYHMATSRACVTDTFWPPVGMLRHRKSLKVVQIWHSIGKIKRSGKISVGSETGRSAEAAKLVNMHEGNDYIIAGAKVFDQFYYDSFGEGHYELKNYGLPRIDYILNTEEENREKFFRENPELKNKTILLYAPTFRRGMEARWSEIINAVDYSRFALIIKNHPSQRIEGQRPEGDVYYFDEWKSMDLLAACDYVITDYSAIALEAAILPRKTCYWVYDYDEYTQKNGLNVDMYESMPGTVFRDTEELMKFIESDSYPMEVLEAYRKKYLPENIGHSTEQIAELIIDIVKG